MNCLEHENITTRKKPVEEGMRGEIRGGQTREGKGIKKESHREGKDGEGEAWGTMGEAKNNEVSQLVNNIKNNAVFMQYCK